MSVRPRLRSLLCSLIVAALAVGCKKDEEGTAVVVVPVVAPPPSADVPVKVQPQLLARFAALPAAADWKSAEEAKAKVELGRSLFHDRRLSVGHDASCSKCHLLSTFGADGKDFSLGHGGRPTRRNTPTIYGASLLPRLFWDARGETLEAAILLHLEDPALMGAPGRPRMEATLRSIPAYVSAFKDAFPGDAQPVTTVNAVNALGAFTRILVTPARWDRFLKGEETSITDAQKIGFEKFVEVGCSECHAGSLVGGDSVQKLGKVRPWPNTSDKGKSHVSRSPEDDMVFRVASLRNVSRTGPWFHDASAKSLGEAVRLMAAHQLGKELDDETVRVIASFLDSLASSASELETALPELPESTLSTPKPVRR